MVRTICAILDKVVAQKPGNIAHFADLITLSPTVRDTTSVMPLMPRKFSDLGWVPQETFESGIEKPCTGILTTRPGGSACWMAPYAGERLGLNN